VVRLDNIVTQDVTWSHFAMKHARSSLWLVVCAVPLLAGNTRAQAQLVTNATFNSPPGGTSTALQPSNSTGLTGWTVDPTSEISGTSGIDFGTSFSVPGLASTQSVQLATGAIGTFKEGGIQQTIATVPGQVYVITIQAKDERNAINSTGGTVSFGGQTHTLASLSESWTGFTWTETATGSSTLLDIVGNSSKVDAVVVSDLSLTLAQIPTVWSGSASANWGTVANWNAPYVPSGAGLAVTFGTAGASGAVDIGAASRTVGIINFVRTVPTTIASSGGNYLYLDDTGGSSASAAINVSGSHSITAPLLLNTPAAFNISGGTDQLSIGAVVGNGTSPNGISLAGSGTLVLAAANTYSGPTTVASGTLLLSNSAALQNSTLAGGAAVFNSTIASHAFILGGLSGNSSLPLTDNAGNPVMLSVGANNSNNTFSGVLSGSGSLAIVGSGTLTLGGANTFTGNTLVTSGGLTLNNAADLQYSLFNASGGGTLSFGSLTAGTFGGLTNGGSLNLVNAAAQAVNLTVGNGGQNATFSGAISGGGTLTMNGAGMQVLSGSNSYGGSSNVVAGTLQFQGGNSLPAASPVGLVAGTLSVRNDGNGSGGTIIAGNNITILAAATADTINVGNLTAGHTGNTVVFGVLSNGSPSNNFNATINFTGANGYLQSYAGLNLCGNTGDGTTLNPTTTTVIINGPVANQETTTASTHYDTLDLDGTSTGNIIYGPISDATPFIAVGVNDTRLTKSNSSQWTLAGQNTYSGPTNISGGTLQLGTGLANQDGTLGNTSGVTDNAALVYNLFGSQTANYGISGAGSVTMKGPGGITLAASNSYTGPTLISNGTLALGAGGSISQSPAITLGTGATFDVSQVANFQLAAGQMLSGTGSYYVNGALTAASGSMILPGGVASAGTLNVGGLTLSTGSTLSYDLGSPQGQDLINVNGTFGGLTVNGGGIALYQANGMSPFSTPGTYMLANYGFSLGGSITNLSVLNPAATNTYTFTATGGSLEVTIGVPDTWTGGAHPSFVWSNPANWSPAQAPANGQTIAFAGAVGLSNTNDIAAGLNLAGIQFGTSAGAFNLNGNSIQLAGPIVNNSSAAQTIGLNITLAGYQNIVAAAGNISLNGVIDDGGQGYGMNISGAGTVVLGGANTYSGTTTVTGPLRLANNAALQNSMLNLAPGGTLSFATGITSPALGGLTGSANISLATSSSQPVMLAVGNSAQAQNTTYYGVLGGAGGLVKQGNATLTLTASQNYSGATTISGGVLQLLPPPPTGSIGIRFQAGSTLTIGSDGPAGAVMSNWNNLTGLPSGSNLVNNSNRPTGCAITITGTSGGGSGAETSGSTDPLLSGYYYFGNTSGLITATITGIPFPTYSLYAFSSDETANHQNALTMGGSTFYFTAENGNTFVQITNTNSSLATSTTGNYAVVSGLSGGSQQVTIYSAQDTGLCGFEIVSTGTVGTGGNLPSTTPLAISNGGTFDMTNCQQQVLSLSSTDGQGSQVYLGGGALTIAGPANTTFDGVISGAGGSLIVQGGRLTLTGQNTYSGATTIIGATLQLTTGGNGQDGTISSTSVVNDNGTLLYNYSDNQSIAYVTGGIGSLVQAGTATLTLLGNNTYTGTTTISGGTLQLGNGSQDGALAGTSLVVDNAALVYDLAGSQTAAYGIRGSGTLIISGGTLALWGANFYSGGTFVNSGMLIVGNAGALPAGSSLTVGQGAMALFAPAIAAPAVPPGAAIAVPEPGSWALLSAAGIVAAAWRLRRERYLRPDSSLLCPATPGSATIAACPPSKNLRQNCSPRRCNSSRASVPSAPKCSSGSIWPPPGTCCSCSRGPIRT
jgi:fibronectin-binding autotransporter adhesin